MAIVTAHRFTESAGGICIDQESWHIWRRKNWFSDHLYPLVSREAAEKYRIDLVYGGIGHPPFHQEVAAAARKKIASRLGDLDETAEPITVEQLGRLVLDAFKAAHRRRIDDKLQYFYGFSLDEFNAGEFQRDGERIPIRRQQVKNRAMDIIAGKETPGYSPFSPPVEACLIGIDGTFGFSAFALKENDGVLSFQSCWFEALGQGRDGAAIRFADDLNRRFLDTRRKGPGKMPGLLLLLEATMDAMDHYGQNGGSVRFIVLDDAESDMEKRRLDIRDDTARLAMEIVRGYRLKLLPKTATLELLEELVFRRTPFDTVERWMFQATQHPEALGKALRGYKIQEGNLSEASPEKALFSPKEPETVSREGAIS